VNMLRFINQILILVFGICLVQISKAQEINQPKTAQDWVLSKNYFVSYLIFKDDELARVVFSDNAVQTMLADRSQRFVESKDCHDLACILDAFKWSDKDMRLLNSAILNAMNSSQEFKAMVENTLIPSNRYGIAGKKDAVSYVAKAFQQDMENENYVIDV